MEDTRKTMTIKDRLAILEDVVSKPSFRSSRGKANEVNYWVFDYDPEDELALRRGIHDIEGKSRNSYPLQVFDLQWKLSTLFETIEVKFTRGEGDATRFAKNACERGFDAVSKAIGRSLRLSNEVGGAAGNKLVEYLANHADPESVLFLTGIGKCYPILRAQEVFNRVFYNMPSAYSHTPMVLFYPGIYTELELKIFGKVHEDNYYRAFRIVR